MKARDIKTKLLFLRHCIGSSEDTMLKEIVTMDLEDKMTKWAKQIRRYLDLMSLTPNQVTMTSKTIVA